MNITPVVNAVIALAAAVVTAFVVPWIKSKTTAAQREEIDAWVRIAVTAAEQIYRETGKGKEKKAYVLKFLEEKNLKIDEESVDLMIESAVKNMNKSFGREG
ncbi:MAG: phage holin [Ruminococcaceae bacterium]|nr:phage holin [Oscillospiraceae bacterium]